MNGLRRIYGPAMLAGVVLSVAGCGVAPKTALTPEGKAVLHAQGRVHGGQQPVSGSTVQVWAAGTGGDGSSATQETASVLTDQNGGFTLPDMLSCSGTSGSTMLYLTATGGQPLTGVTNNNLAMMTAFGACSNWNVNSFISINEVTTVGAVSALSGYMTGPTAVGSGSSDAAALASAFATAEEYVDSASGASPGNGVSSGYSVPTTTINTLADALSACINSAGGSASDGGTTSCGLLFGYTTPSGGSAPTDTITAMLNLALYPTLNTTGVFNLVPSQSPFQPTMTSLPPDFHVHLTPTTASGYVLQVEPSSISFPDTVVSATTATQTIVLENKGGAALTLGTMSLTGTNASEFTLTNGCGSTLAVAATCSLTVKATPTASGAQTAYVSVASSSPDSPQYISLAVNGVAASSVGKLSADTAAVSPALSGVSQVITLSNPGTAPVTISSIATQTTQWPITYTSCGSTLAANTTCIIIVTNVAGGTDALEIVSNDPASPLWIDLYTYSVAAYLTPSMMWFGGTLVGQTATAQSATYYTNAFPTYDNSGNSGAYLSLSITGPNAGDFTVTGTDGASNACLIGYVENYQCGYNVAFKPTAPGLRVAYITLGSGSTSVMPIYGYAISGSPGNLGWSTTGNVSTLTNYGSSVATISSITISTGFTQTNNCGSSLASNASCQITGSAIATPLFGQTSGLLTVVTSVGSEYAGLTSSTGLPTLDFGYGHLGSVTSKTYFYQTSQASQANGLASLYFSGSPSGFSSLSCSVYRNNCSGTLSFTPSTAGPMVGSVSVSDSSGGGAPVSGRYNYTYVATATGIGQLATGPSVSQITNATTPTFTSAFYTAPYSGPTYMFWNSGTTTVNLSASFTGAQANAYSVVTNTCGTSLAPLATCSLTLELTTTSYGLQTANLVLTDSTSGQSWNFPQSLYAIPDTYFIFGFSPGAFGFPATQLNAVSSPVSNAVTVPNEAAITTSISPATEFTATKSSCAQGESPCKIIVAFHPTSGGSHSATMTATSTSGWTATASLSGSLPAATAVASTNTLTFPSTASGSTAQMSFTLTNAGTPAFTLTAVPTSGTNASEFYASNGCGSSVASATSCTITVTFAPTSAGSKTATLSIVGQTSAGLPITLSLFGSSY